MSYIPKLNCINLKTTAVNQSVNPKDFGAKGDGVFDDTPAFKKALQNGKTITVSLPKKYYLIKDTLNVSSNTTISIEKGTQIRSSGSNLFSIKGVSNVVIKGGNVSKLAGNSSIHVDNSKDISISDFSINHNSGENFDLGSNGDGFRIGNSSRVHLTNVSAINIRGKGIRFTKCKDSSLTFSYFKRNERSGISMIGGCENILIADNVVENCMNGNRYSDGAIDIYGGSDDGKLKNHDITIERNQIIKFGEKAGSKWPAATGIRVNATEGARVLDNYIKPNGVITAAIRVEERIGLSSSDVTIANNEIRTKYKVDSAGIQLGNDYGSDITIANNKIKSTYENDAHAIYIKRPGISGISITDNTIEWNGGFCLYSIKNEGINDVTVVGNVFKGTGDGIYLRYIDKGLVNGNTIRVGGIAIKMRYVDNTLVIGNTLKGSERSFIDGNDSSSMVNNTESITS